MGSDCQHCGRPFAEPNDLYNHMRSKHPRKPRAHLQPPRRHASPDSESVASELVDAMLDYQCGGEPPLHLVEMFPEMFCGDGNER